MDKLKQKSTGECIDSTPSPCSAGLMNNQACASNSTKSDEQIISDAHRDRLDEGLRNLADWCNLRERGNHDTYTTLTMLENKAAGLREKCMKAGWAALKEHHMQNAIGMATTETNETTK